MPQDDTQVHPVDLHVGARLRMRRKAMGLSQDELGKSVGITFQQVQKYERAANRVSASKLYEFAQILKVDITFFYEGLEANSAPRFEASTSEQAVTAFLSTAEGIELSTWFPRIRSAKWRRKLLDLVRVLPDEADTDSSAII